MNSLDKYEAPVIRIALASLSKLEGGFFWRANVGGTRKLRFGYPGQADITGVYKGFRFEIECKSAIGKQSKEQKVFQQKIEEAGGIYLLVNSIKQAQMLAMSLKTRAAEAICLDGCL